MDFHSMKRKELQALCKKNGIPANLTNLEMANKLTLLLKEKEKPATRRRRSCLKNTEEMADENNNSDIVARQSKKVRFSPDHELIIFGDNPVRVTRARAQKSAEGSEIPLISPPPQKKRTRKVVGVHGTEVKDGNSGDKTPPETTVPIRKSLRIKEVMGENQKESEQNNPIQGSPRKRKAKGIDEISESNDLPAKWGEKLRRSKRSVRKVEDSEQPKGELGTCETGGKGKFTQPQTELAVEMEDSDVERETGTETEIDVPGEQEVVLQLEEPIRCAGKNGNRRKSVLPQNEKVGTNGLKGKNESRKLSGFPETEINGKGRATRSRAQFESEAKVEEESEVVLQSVEVSRNPVRNGNRRKSVRWQIEKVGANNGPTSENESTKLSKGSDGEGRSIAEIPKREKEASLPSVPQRRTRRETSMFKSTIPTNEELGSHETVGGNDLPKQSSGPFVEKEGLAEENVRRSRRNASRHETAKTTSTVIGKNKPRKGKRDRIVDEETVVTECASLIKEHPRRSTRNAAESESVIPAVVTSEVVRKKLQSTPKSPNLELESPLAESLSVVQELPTLDSRLSMLEAVGSKQQCEQISPFLESGSPLAESLSVVQEPPISDAQLTMPEVVAKRQQCEPISPFLELGSPVFEILSAIKEPPTLDAQLSIPKIGGKKQQWEPISPFLELASSFAEGISVVKQSPTLDANSSMPEVAESGPNLSNSQEVSEEVTLKESNRSPLSREVSTRISDLVESKSVYTEKGAELYASASEELNISDCTKKDTEMSFSESVVTEKVDILTEVNEGKSCDHYIPEVNDDGMALQPSDSSRYLADHSSPLYQSHDVANLENILDLGKELETYESAHEVDSVPKGQNLEEGDGFGEQMHKLVVGGHLAECNRSEGSMLSSENFSEEDEDVSPTRLKDKDTDETEKCFSRTQNMVVKTPLTEENIALSSSKVSKDTKNASKCSTKKSSLEKQCSPTEVSFKSPDLVVDKERLLLVVGNENLLQSDIHNGNDYDFASQSQKGSMGFDRKSSVELEPVEDMNKASEVVATDASSSGDCFSPLHQLNHSNKPTNLLSTGEELKAEDSLLYSYSHQRGISGDTDAVGEDNYPIDKEKNLAADCQDISEPSTHERNCGNVSKKASEISPLDISHEGMATMNIVEGNIEKGKYYVESAKLWENLSASYSPPARDVEEKVTDVEFTSGDFSKRTPLLNTIVASECHASQLDNEVTHSIASASASTCSINKDERQQGNGMWNEERVEESSADLENEPEGASEMERALRPVNQETSCVGIEGNPCMDGNVNEVGLELAVEKENEGSNRVCVHVYEEIMGGSVSELPDRERVGHMISESDTDRIKELLTPVITPESSDDVNNESISAFQHIPLKNDDGSGEDGLNHLFATPAKNSNPVKGESCSRETEFAGVSMAKDSLQKVVRTTIGGHEKTLSTVNALPSSGEEITDEDSNKYVDTESNKNVEEITNALPTFDLGNNESMSSFQCVPLKNDDDSEEDGLKLLFATPNNANPSKEESCRRETEIAAVSMTEDLLREVRTKRSEHKRKSCTGNVLPTSGEEIADEDSNKNVDTEHTRVIRSTYSEMDDSIFEDRYVAYDKQSGWLEQNSENASSEHTCMNVREVPVEVELPPIASEERENDIFEDLEEALPRKEVTAEFYSEVADTDRISSEDMAPCSPSYAPEHQATEYMVSSLHMLSTSCAKQDQEAKGSREGIKGDLEVEFDILATGDEKDSVLSEVELCGPEDCNEAASPVNGSAGAGLTETVYKQTKACPPFGPLGPNNVATDHPVEFAERNTNSLGASDELSENVAEVKLITAGAEDYSDSVDVLRVKKGIVLDHGQVDSSGPTIHIVEIAQEMDMNASMDPDKLEDLVTKSHGSDGTMPQVDQVEFADFAGQKMELMVQDADISAFHSVHRLPSDDCEDGDNPQEAAIDVTVTVLQGHETKLGDINSQNIVGITDDSTNIMDENSIAENKEENVPDDFDHQLEIEKRQKIARLSPYNHGEENEFHCYQENLRVTEREDMAEVVPDDQFNGTQEFTVMLQPSQEDNQVKDLDIDSTSISNVSSDSKEGFDVEDIVRTSVEDTKEPLIDNEDLPEKNVDSSGPVDKIGDIINGSTYSNDFRSPGRCDAGGSEFNFESHLFSSWEMNLFSGYNDGDEAEKSYGGDTKTNFSYEDSKEYFTVTHDEDLEVNHEHHIEEKVAEPVSEVEVNEEDDEAMTTMKSNEFQHTESESTGIENSSVFVNDLVCTEVDHMEGCEQTASVEPRTFGEDKYEAVESFSTSVEDIKSLVQDQNSGMAHQSFPSIDLAVGRGSATEDAQMLQPNSDSVQRNFTTARVKGNSPSPKQLNSMSMTRKNLKTSLVQSTPKKQISMIDMKENEPSTKREDFGTVKTAKTASKRRALEDLGKR